MASVIQRSPGLMATALVGHVSTCRTRGLGVDQGSDGRVAAQPLQAPSATGPDAPGRDAQPRADLGIRDRRVCDEQGEQLLAAEGQPGNCVTQHGLLLGHEQVLIAESIPDTETATVEQELLVAEQHAVLRDALARLPPGCRQLLVLLSADPPVPYAEISARLGISVGSIGPNRRRCLDRLARDPAIAALIGTEAASTAG